MRTEGSFWIKWRYGWNNSGRKSGCYGIHSRRYAPPASWHRVHVKARWKVGGSKAALIRHANYITQRDKFHTESRDQETVKEFGDVVGFAKEIGGKGDHYRNIIAPRRGDLIDMENLLINTVKNVQKREGEFKWAAVIHRMKEPNSIGIYNQHIHMIIEGGFGGSAMFRRVFREEARREASRQIDQMKLIGRDMNIDREITKETQISMRKS